MPSASLRVTDRHVFFHDGWPSHWHKAAFTVDRVKYTCGEQFMMAEKARVFDDREARRDILRAQNPREQKAIGRRVRNFDDELWQSLCRAIVYTGNLAKFTQNESLKDKLLATAPLLLVEASPADTIWGVGLAKEDPRIDDPAKWQGTNWLGIALTQVRRTLEAHAANRTFEPDAELAQQLARYRTL